MKNRCFNPKVPYYSNYGGRGITVCERWLKFENFFADMGLRPTGTSIDRIDVNGNYEPSNCKWSTDKEQSRNRRCNVMLTINGETKCVSEWAEIKGVSKERIRMRMIYGWPTEKLFDPSHKVKGVRNVNPNSFYGWKNSKK